MNMVKNIFQYIKKNKILWIILIPAFIFHLLIMWPSGSNLCFQGRCGLYFWGTNDHDALWHLALSSTSFNHWPFIAPTFAGVSLSGYNYLIDLVIYLISLLGISPSFSFFKLIPFIWFATLTCLLISLGRKIKDSPIFITWLLFFSFFGSSFAFFFPLYHSGSIWGGAALLSMQSGHALTNIPFAVSLIFLLFILLIIKKGDYGLWSSLFLGVLLFINVGLKFYGGLTSIFIVYLAYAINFFRSKKIFNISNLIITFRNVTIMTLFVLLSVLIFYDPFSSLKSGAIFIFSPFATMHSMIEEPALFYLKDMINARYFLYAYGNLLSPRLIFIELFSSALFLFFSMGLRIFGVLYFLIKAFKKKVSVFDSIIFLTLVFTYSFLVLFIQKGQWWNTVQFYYYFLFLLNIFTAEFFYEILLKKKRIFVGFIVIIVIVLSIPINLDLISNFARFPALSYIPQAEVQALDFLKNQPNGVVFMAEYEKRVGQPDIYPKPLFYSTVNSYIPAYSGKPVYLADEMQLEITGVDYKKRLSRIKKNDCSILKEVDYIYQIKTEKSPFFDKCLNSEVVKKEIIFDNSLVKIFKIK